MKRLWAVVPLAVLLTGTLSARPIVLTDKSDDENDDSRLKMSATLKGIEEPPAVSSTGRGSFKARVGDDGISLEYTLKYSGLEGSITQAHIHLGQRGVNGGIAVFLCSNLANGPAGTPLCPGTSSGEVSGTVSEIVGPAGQGLVAGEFEELLRAIDKDVTYANMHTTKHPGGEIRGQIEVD